MKTHKFVWLIFVVLAFIFCFTSCFSTDGGSFERQRQIAPEPTPACNIAIKNEEELNEDALFLAAIGIIDAKDYQAYSMLSRGMAARIVSDMAGLSGKAKESEYTHPFIDLTEEYENQISFLYYNGIVDGITGNTFKEEDICGLPAFLTYLIRALDYAGGTESDVTEETAIARAEERGIIAEGYATENNGVLSVNEAFSICSDALYAYINEGLTLLAYLAAEGKAQPVQKDYGDAYEIYGSEVSPFYEETFDDKKMDGYDAKSSEGRVVWQGSHSAGADNAITRNGYLQISGEEQYLVENQQIALKKSLMQEKESYGMTFTVNIQCMGNEGNEGRVIFRVIPRTADEEFTKYYAINYYMVIPLDNYIANLARCKWSITNTNAPTGTEPLAEAYFLLEENVDYTGRVLIENTEDGAVHIEFYIDGADRDAQNAGPLMEYTDTSEYKIMESAEGPAFGNSGYLDSGWGPSSTSLFDDVKIYDVQNFKLKEKEIQEYSKEEAELLSDGELYTQMNYLLKNGVIIPYQRRLQFAANVTVEQFLATAMYLNGRHLRQGQSLGEFVASEYQTLFKGTKAEKETDLGRDITRYEAAVIIKSMMKGTAESLKYESFYEDELDEDYTRQVYFAVQNSYLLLDNENKFNGTGTVTRDELLLIMSKAVDSRLRDENYTLQVPAVFSDNAILQRDKTIPVSGRGMSGDTVTVEFAGRKKTVTVTDGGWLAELDSMPAGGPYDLKISDSGYSYTYKNLYVGEVFVVAGQSNAEWNVYDSEDNEDTLRKFNDQTKVRLFSPASVRGTTPLFDSETKWQVARDQWSEYIFGSASAIGVFSVQKLMSLNNDLEGVKIGIIQLTYGGTSIELFMPSSVSEKYVPEQADDEFIFSGFWNGYMEGVAPFAARALMYYQGENSTHLEHIYEIFLRDYISGARAAFYDEALPVMLVQLAGYGESYGQDSDSWAKIREVQQRVANTTENVGLVTAIDLSDADRYNIHPSRKREIGDRLAWLAMDLVYGSGRGKASRQMTEYQLDGNVYSIKFAAEELTFAKDPLGDVDFEVMTAEGKWIAAQSKTEGDTLFVWSDDAQNPVGVRYAWANYPRAVIYDENGLPVLPFNTAKDLYKITPESDFTTDETHLKKAYHLMSNNDAVINLTRNNELRHVLVLDAYRVEYTDGEIEGQQPGDRVVLLKKGGNILSESGTSETLVIKTAHGLKAGDWVLNTKYNEIRKVLEIIDENTFRIDLVENQAAGNIFETFICIGEITAQK